METEVTSHEVGVGRMISKVSILEENVLSLEMQVKEYKENGENMILVLEEMKRERKSLEMKLCTSENEQDKLKEEVKKLREDVGVKEDELMLYEHLDTIRFECLHIDINETVKLTLTTLTLGIIG